MKDTAESMNAKRDTWESQRIGPSPLCGGIRNISDKLKKGIIIRDIIGTFENNISMVGYRDAQNRLVGYEMVVLDKEDSESQNEK